MDASATVKWGAVAWWLLVGAGAAFAVVSLLSVGVFVLPVVVVLAVVGVVVRRLRSGVAPGLALGAALVPLWLAWLNRSGPGTVCTATATEQACTEQYSPWPFLVVGLGLLGVGAFLIARTAGGARTLVPASAAQQP